MPLFWPIEELVGDKIDQAKKRYQELTSNVSGVLRGPVLLDEARRRYDEATAPVMGGLANDERIRGARAQYDRLTSGVGDVFSDLGTGLRAAQGAQGAMERTAAETAARESLQAPTYPEPGQPAGAPDQAQTGDGRQGGEQRVQGPPPAASLDLPVNRLTPEMVGPSRPGPVEAFQRGVARTGQEFTEGLGRIGENLPAAGAGIVNVRPADVLGASAQTGVGVLQAATAPFNLPGNVVSAGLSQEGVPEPVAEGVGLGLNVVTQGGVGLVRGVGRGLRSLSRALPERANLVGAPIGAAIGAATGPEDQSPQERLGRAAVGALLGPAGVKSARALADLPNTLERLRQLRAVADEPGGFNLFDEDLAGDLARLTRGIENRLSAHSDLTEQIGGLQERIAALREMAKVKLERPPPKVAGASWKGLSEGDYYEVAARAGVNPHEPGWWQQIDPESLRLYRQEARARRGPQPMTPMQELRRIVPQERDLRKQYRTLEQQLTQDITRQAQLEDRVAANGVRLPEADAPVAPDETYRNLRSVTFRPERPATPEQEQRLAEAGWRGAQQADGSVRYENPRFDRPAAPEVPETGVSGRPAGTVRIRTRPPPSTTPQPFRGPTPPLPEGPHVQPTLGADLGPAQGPVLGPEPPPPPSLPAAAAGGPTAPPPGTVGGTFRPGSFAGGQPPAAPAGPAGPAFPSLSNPPPPPPPRTPPPPGGPPGGGLPPKIPPVPGAGAPTEPPPGRLQRFGDWAERMRYATGLLASPAGALRDAVSTAVNVAMAYPRTFFTAGLEGGLQRVGRVAPEQRSATLDQLTGMTAGARAGFVAGFQDFLDILKLGSASPAVRTTGAPQAPLVKGLRGLPLEFGYRLRMASDAWNGAVGDRMWQMGLAFREANRAGYTYTDPEFFPYAEQVARSLGAKMDDLRSAARAAEQELPQGPVRATPRVFQQGGITARPQVGARGPFRGNLQPDMDALAHEVFGMSQRGIFQQTPGTMAGALGAARARSGIGRVVPFFRTLANIAAQGVEHDPVLGTLGTAIDVARGAAGAGPYRGVGLTESTSAAVLPATQRLANGVIFGSGLAALGYGLREAGLMTGLGPADASVRRQMQDEGWRQLAVPVLGGNVPIGWLLGPYALPIAFGAMWHDYQQQGRFAEDLPKAWRELAFQRVGQWGTQAGLRDVYEFVNSIMSPDPQEQGRSFERLAGGVLGSYMPMSGVLRLVNQTTDPVIRDPRNLQERLMSGIPGGEGAPTAGIPLVGRIGAGTVEPRRTATGEVLERSPGERGLAVLSPFQVTATTPGQRRYFDSAGPEQDAEITAAINAYRNWARDPSTHREPTARQADLFFTFAGAEDPYAAQQRKLERQRRRQRANEEEQRFLGMFRVPTSGGP